MTSSLKVEWTGNDILKYSYWEKKQVSKIAGRNVGMEVFIWNKVNDVRLVHFRHAHHATGKTGTANIFVAVELREWLIKTDKKKDTSLHSKVI